MCVVSYILQTYSSILLYSILRHYFTSVHQNVSYQKVRVSPALLAFDLARPSMGITVVIAFTSERFQLAPTPIYYVKSKEKRKTMSQTHRQRQERATVEQILTGRSEQ